MDEEVGDLTKTVSAQSSPCMTLHFTNGIAELDKPKADMMARLREAVSKKLVDDQWMHGPTDYMEDLRIANHGRV